MIFFDFYYNSRRQQQLPPFSQSTTQPQKTDENAGGEM